VIEPAPPPPPPKVEPRQEPEPERKADIVLEEKKRREVEAKRLETEKRDAEKRAAEKREAQKRETEKREAAKRETEKREAAKREAEKQERLEAQKRAAEQAAVNKRREQELQRIAAAAGGGPASAAGSGMAGATGVAGGFSRGYEGQVVGCIRPHIVFNVPENVKPKQFVAEFEVQLLPTGEQAGAPKLLKASGLAAFDQAVERAIRRCEPFPRPKEGAMPRTLRLTFDPVDTR
jgi:colicin import membrane protein